MQFLTATSLLMSVRSLSEAVAFDPCSHSCSTKSSGDNTTQAGR